MLELPDIKSVVEEMRLAAEVAKATKRLIKQLRPILQKIPWPTIARAAATVSLKAWKALKEALTPPRPWPRTKLVFKFSCTVAAYIVTIFGALLTLSYFFLLQSAHLPLSKVVAAVIVLVLMGAGNIMQFVQAEHLCILMAKNSRVLWKSKAP